MHRIDTPGNVIGLFVPPDPVHGQQAVRVDSSWLNDIQENLIGILVAAAIAPVKDNHGQVLTALQALFAKLAANTFTDTQTVRAGASSAAYLPYLQLRPTDYAAGKPELYLGQGVNPMTWEIGLYDGVSDGGLLVFRAIDVSVTGLVGIGTTSPNRQLHVVGATTSEISLQAYDMQADHSTWNFIVEGTAGAPADFAIRRLNDAGTLSSFDTLHISGATGLATLQAVTQSPGDSSANVATTAFVTAALAAAFGFTYSAGANGYLAFPASLGGIVIQWGQATIGPISGGFANGSFSFPLPFPTACWVVIGSAEDNDAGGGVGAAGNNYNAIFYSRSTSGCSIRLDNEQGVSSGSSYAVGWFAIGN